MNDYASIEKAIKDFDRQCVQKVSQFCEEQTARVPSVQTTVSLLKEFKKSKDPAAILGYLQQFTKAHRESTKENAKPKPNVNKAGSKRKNKENVNPYVKLERISEELVGTLKLKQEPVVKREPVESSEDDDVVEIKEVVEVVEVDDDNDEVMELRPRSKRTKPVKNILIAEENVRSTRSKARKPPPEIVEKMTTRTKLKSSETKSTKKVQDVGTTSSRNNEAPETRSTRTKGRTKDVKRNRSRSGDLQSSAKKVKLQSDEDNSVYEDAIDDSGLIKGKASYHQSPVKKRVEAFEKMVETAQPPMRITRTKTKKLAEEGIAVNVTPTSNRTTRQPAITAAKISNLKNVIATGSESRTLSALKASQQKFKEREKARLQKEAELAKKKEALLLERKKRFELEKRMEERKLQKKRDEEIKKMEQEMKRKLAEEERRRKVAEEERRRKVAEEEDRRKAAEEEEKRLNEAKAKNEVYMQQDAPLLPTYDCYDSDDPEAYRPKKVAPKWLEREKLHSTLTIMTNFIKPKVLNTLFCPTPQTPNLLDIFDNVNPNRLKRNSSAIWSKPPRFTMMPPLKNSHV